MAKKKIDKIQDETKQITTSGLYVPYAGGIQDSEFSQVSWDELQRDYYEMRMGDSICSTALDVLKLPIYECDYMLENETETERTQEIRDYVYWCFTKLKDGFESLKYHSLLSLDYGCIFFEKVKENAVDYNGKTTNIIKRLYPIQNQTIYSFHTDEYMEYESIVHQRRSPLGTINNITIPMEKLLVFTHLKEFNNILGRSELRPGRKAWRYKNSILDATARSIEKGTGLAVLYHNNTASQEEISAAKQTLRTIGNAKDAYCLLNKDVFELELKDWANQNDNMSMLEYLDRQQFYNTLTQFMVSGIAGNGSRAATSEHKSTFEFKVGSIKKELEEQFQKLVEEMLSISYLGNISTEEIPLFKLVLKDEDINLVSDSLIKLVSSGVIQKQEGDEEWIRQSFGLPVIKEVQSSSQTIDNTVEEKVEDTEMSLNPETDLNDPYFTIRENIYKAEEKSLEIILEMMNKVKEDVCNQLEANGNKTFSLRYKKEFYTKLSNLYNEIYSMGKNDVKVNFEEIKKEFSEDIKTTKNRLSKLIDKAYFEIENSFDDGIVRLPIKYLESKGGVREYIQDFKFTKIMNYLTNEIVKGYLSGRMDMIKHNLADDDKFVYTSKMDKNVCQECVDLEGKVFTRGDIDTSVFLQFDTPTNLLCNGRLGNNECRCILTPTK